MNATERFLKQLIDQLDADEQTKQDVYDEMSDHLELSKRSYIDNGHSESEAERRALADFGGSKRVGRQLNRSISPLGVVLRTVEWVLLIIYLTVLLVQLLVGKLVFYLHGGGWTTERLDNYQYLLSSDLYNLIPLRTISNYWLHHNRYNFDIWFNNTIGNVLAWIPLGILLPLLFRRCRKPTAVLVISASLALFIEVVQLVTQSGIADIDSILLRTAGAMLGYGLFAGTRQLLYTTRRIIRPKLE